MAAPLHILILSDRDWTHPQGGGTGTNLYGQVARWLAWGHRVTVVACSYPGALAEEQHGGLTHPAHGRALDRLPARDLARPPAQAAGGGRGARSGQRHHLPHAALAAHAARSTLVHHIHRDHYVAEMGLSGRVAAWLLETAPLGLLYRLLALSHDLQRVGRRHRRARHPA